MSTLDGAAPAGEKQLEKPKRLRFLRSLTLPGCWGALLASCLSFTPSLLPRGGVVQGVVWGISAAIGYGVGVVLASVWRAFADRDPRPPRSWSWRVLWISAAVLLTVFFGLGQYWQYLIRHMMGVSEYNVWLVVLSPLVAAAVLWLILLTGRGIRAVFRWTAERLGRRIGRRAARAVGWILVAGVTYFVITGLLLQGLVGLANDIFSVRDGATPEGVRQPTNSLRSGGPGSVVPWDSLGRQGRGFVGTGPTQQEIAAFDHRPAMEPIRAYAGLGSAGDTEARAQLAVQDLERAGAFHRKNLLVVTTTGSGWVDPAAVDSFEYLTGGDSATVAIQYSYLPSWISYLVDQSKAKEAGRDLFDAVYGAWGRLPQASRPKLYVAGESLGSFGGETAFSGENDLANRTAGTLFVGPPNFNTLFREFSDHREPGSPEIQPVYKDGRIIRFTSDPAAPIPPTGQSWDGTRVLYLMHPSDPIVWWSPHLVFSEPDWIAETPGSDVLKGTVWIPAVTFWQVTADLPFSTGVPEGHGHTYSAEYVYGWNTVLRPSGISTQDLEHLKKIIASE